MSDMPIDQETLFGVLRRARAKTMTKVEACAAVLEVYRLMSEVFMAFVRGAAEERSDRIRAEIEACAQLAEEHGSPATAAAIRGRTP